MYNLQQLKCFRTMAEYENYSRASEILFMSQSTLSYTISQLEKELGVPLFEKDGKHVRLTEYGSRFREYCEKILNTYEIGQGVIEEMKDPLQGVVKVGHYSSVIYGPFREAILEFSRMQRYSKIRLSLRTVTSENAASSLRSGELDVTLTKRISHGSIESQKLYSNNMVLITSSDFPLESGNASIEDVKDYPLLLLAKNTHFRIDQEQFFKERNVKPKVIIEVPSLPDMINYVEAGYGVAITPYLGEFERRSIKQFNISDGIFLRDIYINYLPEKLTKPVISTFVSFMTAYFSKQGELR